METLSLSGRGIYRLEPGQLGMWVQTASAPAALTASDDGAPAHSGDLLPLRTVPNPSTTAMLGARLRHLDLSHNVLESLCGLEGLSQLRILDVSHNRLTTLNNDQGFGGGLPLTLTHLNLSHNQLVSLGDVSVLTVVNRTSRSHGGPLQALQQLEVVDVSFNRLENLKGLPGSSLIELEAGYNELRKLDGVEQCRRLVVLCVSHNLLKDTEDVASLKSLVNLRTLAMEGNPLVVRKRKLQSLLYLLPPSLAQTDLAIALPDPPAALSVQEDMAALLASRPLLAAPPVPSFASSANPPAAASASASASAAAAAACSTERASVQWETVVRVLQEELASVKAERDCLAARVALLEGRETAQTPPGDRRNRSAYGVDSPVTIHRSPPLAPAPARAATATSIMEIDREPSFVTADGSPYGTAHVGARGHPYDLSVNMTGDAQNVSATSTASASAGRSPARDKWVASADKPSTSTNLSGASGGGPQDSSRIDRRNAAKDVMLKLRRANVQ